MAHPIWSGTVGFGLVTIPVKLYTAVHDRGGLAFHFLHDKDSGKIKNERVCSECGQKVPWEHVVRGYEYEKGSYVVVTDEDFAKASVEATQSVDIVGFVELAEIDPMFFDKPYYLEPEKKGRHAYALLRDALRESGRVGVARVVLRSREHIAAVRPDGPALLLEMMHWADDLVPPASFDFPASEKATAAEMKASRMLIDAMTAPFDPHALRDTYTDQLMSLIERKAEGRPVPRAAKGPRPATNVVDLVSALKKSLAAKPESKPPLAKGGRRRGSRKTAA